MNIAKWRVFKHHGVWNVCRPGEQTPCEVFPNFQWVLAWKPDCEHFLSNRCKCRMGCAR